MKNKEFAVITGSGVTNFFELSEEKKIMTDFGEATVYIEKNNGYYVLPRHGREHALPPHMINYRANMYALYEIGVRKIISTNAVGTLKRSFKVGSVGLLSQFIDMTKQRYPTIFTNKVYHADMTEPYSKDLNKKIMNAASRLGIRLKDGLVYACMEGPRYETKAEIRMLRIVGADVVGMTSVPEVVYSRELNIDYSAIVVATNWAAGMQEKLSHEEVLRTMSKAGKVVKKIIDKTFLML